MVGPLGQRLEVLLGGPVQVPVTGITDDQAGRGTPAITADAERIVGELKAYEAEHGPLTP